MDDVAAVVAQLKDFGQPVPALSPSGEGSLLYSGRLAEGMHGHWTRRKLAMVSGATYITGTTIAIDGGMTRTI